MHAQQLEAMAGPLAGILDEVGFVEDDAGPGDGVEPFGVFAQEIVVDDDPAWRIDLVLINAKHFDARVAIDHEDFASPVELQRRGAHDEDNALWASCLHGDDGLAGLAQAHVVGEDGALLGQQECDAVGLVGIQAALCDLVDARGELDDLVDGSSFSLVLCRGGGRTS